MWHRCYLGFYFNQEAEGNNNGRIKTPDTRHDSGSVLWRNERSTFTAAAAELQDYKKARILLRCVTDILTPGKCGVQWVCGSCRPHCDMAVCWNFLFYIIYFCNNTSNQHHWTVTLTQISSFMILISQHPRQIASRLWDYAMGSSLSSFRAELLSLWISILTYTAFIMHNGETSEEGEERIAVRPAERRLSVQHKPLGGLEVWSFYFTAQGET